MIGGGMPNQERWDQVIQEFVASDSQVGAVNLTPSNDGLEALTEQYDCFTLPYNAIPGSDLSGVLSLDPYLDTDVSFDRNAVIGNTLAQLQLNNQTWAMPLAIQPEALRYDSNLFAQAGAVAPENGWSTDQFIDALRLLKNVTGETSPFISQTPGGSHLLMLMAAFGGLPIDYRTNPPTLNFSDQTTVDAIRQVLDLAKQGYIEYNELSAQEFVVINDGEGDPVAITTDSLSPFSFQARVGGEDTTRLTTYPTGTYGVVSYQITTGYISTNAQNADACYRWLSTLARHPELFSGMPAQSSILDDPAVTAAQGAGTVEAFRQFDALIRDPNTVVMPAGFRTGGSPADFLQEYWLLRAFDRYVLQDADLAAELADAQIITQAFQQCAANLPPVENGNPGAAFEGILTCAQTADPTFEAG
jgi:ABC-type glycerol-3-phosphate transport system substrate-binding protein